MGGLDWVAMVLGTYAVCAGVVLAFDYWYDAVRRHTVIWLPRSLEPRFERDIEWWPKTKSR